jgi:hypothetical protein
MGSRLITAVLLLSAQTASVGGTIIGSVHDVTGSPVGGLVAVLFPADDTAWPDAQARGTARRTAVIDGQFEITGVPAGSYKFLLVGDETQLQTWPSAATLSQLAQRITFTVVLSDGPPIRLTVGVHGSGASLAINQFAGTYPGRVFVTPRTAVGGHARVEPAPPPMPGAISGRVTDADGGPVAGLGVRSVRRVSRNGVTTLVPVDASTTTDADGRYRLADLPPGSYLVVALTHSVFVFPHEETAPGPVRVSPHEPRLGSVATFYGNTSDEMAATPVTVTATERSDTDIQLRRLPVFTMIGSIAHETIPVPPPTLLTLVRIDGTGRPSTLDMRTVFIGADSAFRFDDLVDGDYDLAFSGLGAWGWGHARVAGRDPDPIVIVPHTAMLVRGRAEFRGTTPPPPIPAGTSRFAVTLWTDQRTVGLASHDTPIQSDGTFTAHGTTPGPFRLLGLAPDPWFEVAGYVGGVDTLDVAMSSGPDAADAVIVFADHPTALRATVVDAQGQPVANAGVIVFDEDSRYWASQSRRVQIRTTLATGTCSFTNLPPGKYFAVTNPDITASTSVTPALLERLKPTATPFEVVAGRSGAVQLVAR